jgi:hypothetical protein
LKPAQYARRTVAVGREPAELEPYPLQQIGGVDKFPLLEEKKSAKK